MTKFLNRINSIEQRNRDLEKRVDSDIIPKIDRVENLLMDLLEEVKNLNSNIKNIKIPSERSEIIYTEKEDKKPTSNTKNISFIPSVDIKHSKFIGGKPSSIQSDIEFDDEIPDG